MLTTGIRKNEVEKAFKSIFKGLMQPRLLATDTYHRRRLGHQGRIARHEKRAHDSRNEYVCARYQPTFRRDNIALRLGDSYRH